jgi:hypothetical protein
MKHIVTYSFIDTRLPLKDNAEISKRFIFYKI